MSVWNTCVWYLIGWEYIRDTRVEVKNSELFWLATESLNKKKVLSSKMLILKKNNKDLVYNLSRKKKSRKQHFMHLAKNVLLFLMCAKLSLTPD